MDILKSLIGVNLKFYRIKANISQSDLADAAGVSRRTLHAVEVGEHNITLDILEALAGALKIQVKNLITEKRIVLPLGLAAFNQLDWKDGGTWSYGVRDMDGHMVGVSESCEKVTGLKLVKSKNHAKEVTLIDDNTMIVHAPSGDKIMAILRIGVLGPDYTQVGWLSYGYQKGAVHCNDQIAKHIINVILKLKDVQ
jgi:DNA-binding XRE family transcriptional regulator